MSEVAAADLGPELPEPSPAPPLARGCPYCASAASPASTCSGCGLADTPLRRRLLTSWWGSLGLGLTALCAYFLLGQILPGIVAAVAILLQGGSPSPEQLEQQLVPYLPAIVLFGALVAVGLTAAAWLLGVLAPNPNAPSRGPRRMAWVVGCAAVCLLGQQGLAWLLAQAGLEPHEQDLLLSAAQQTGPWFFLAVAVGAPLAEELVFRRLLFGSLLLGCGRPTAWVIATLLFAVVHFNASALLLYAWMALCFTLAYERTGSVWGAFAVHAINNGLATAAFE